MKVVQDEMLQRGLGGYAPQVAAALLLLYYCFTTVALQLRIRAAGHRELGVGVRDITDSCFTTALPLVY